MLVYKEMFQKNKNRLFCFQLNIKLFVKLNIINYPLYVSYLYVVSLQFRMNRKHCNDKVLSLYNANNAKLRLYVVCGISKIHKFSAPVMFPHSY